MFDEFKKGDLAGALESVDHAIEAEPSSTFPGQKGYRGHEGVLRFFAMFLEAWDEYHAEPVMVESDMLQVWTFRGGKAVRMRVRNSREEALGLARGLPP
jgi:hypothetical protein